MSIVSRFEDLIEALRHNSPAALGKFKGRLKRLVGGDLTTPDLVVSRHDGLVEYLREEAIIPAEGIEHIEHAELDDVRDRHIVGNIPSRLAAEAEAVTEVDLDYPEDYRGEEFSADEVREHCTGITTYLVREAEDQLVE